ncbi:EAL domain-containing protein [Salipaludibacillus neizhouensis]|nr:EAL domain-containing protein [Salipaludibacillus neizhouensis]
MEGCQFCQVKMPLSDEGMIKIVFLGDVSLTEIINKSESIGFELFHVDHSLHFTYASWEQLQQFIKMIELELSKLQLNETHGYFIEEGYEAINLKTKIPFTQLALRIKNPTYVKVIQEQLFYSFMQPILACDSEEVYGYEFLLRPSSRLYPFSPADLFNFSQDSGLQSMLDSQSRINAIRTGAQMLSKGTKHFINFLPSSIYDPTHCLKSTFQAVKEYNVDPEDLVFEVVETERIEDMKHLKSIFTQYQKAGVKVALDDIGSGFATIDVLQELAPDYAKIDRELIRNCYADDNKMSLIANLREVTKEMGTILLAEGIETEEEYIAIKPYVDLVQGYYFGKPLNTPAVLS